jgi:hypothetical protein
MINSKDISVVVQGAIDKELTPKCLASIRKQLPNAQIILSTWIGSDVNGLDYDILVENNDPGNTPSFDLTIKMSPEIQKPKQKANNVNRQIVSTFNGLKLVKTKYALKMRTDFIIEHTGFLRYFGKFKSHTNELRVFKEKVVSFSGVHSNNLPFHPCDFLYFGLTEDLVTLFDIPLQTDAQAYYCKTHDIDLENKYLDWKFFLPQFVPEQYIWTNCINKFYPQQIKTFESFSDLSGDNIRLSEIAHVNNFICINLFQYGIFPLKKELLGLRKYYYKSHLTNYIDYIHLYQKYCDKNYRMPIFEKIKTKAQRIIGNNSSLSKLLLKTLINFICLFIPIRRVRKIIRKIYR